MSVLICPLALEEAGPLALPFFENFSGRIDFLWSKTSRVHFLAHNSLTEMFLTRGITAIVVFMVKMIPERTKSGGWPWTTSMLPASK